MQKTHYMQTFIHSTFSLILQLLYDKSTHSINKPTTSLRKPMQSYNKTTQCYNKLTQSYSMFTQSLLKVTTSLLVESIKAVVFHHNRLASRSGTPSLPVSRYGLVPIS